MTLFGKGERLVPVWLLVVHDDRTSLDQAERSRAWIGASWARWSGVREAPGEGEGGATGMHHALII